MVHYSKIEADSLTGAILALEGIRDAVVVLNGPTGCKSYHGALSDRQFPRTAHSNPLDYTGEFYFWQPRVPVTYLDSDDYIFGASEKLARILEVVAAKHPALIAIVNSPGAALIGDDLSRFLAHAAPGLPCVAVESTGFSGLAPTGFQQAVRSVVDYLCPAPQAVVPKRVNLIGVSIMHKHWDGSVAELRRLLGLCGIQVQATLCADVTVADLQTLPSAQCNVVVYPDYGEDLARWLHEKFGTAFVIPSEGLPVGFDATEAWIREVACAVDVDPAPALAAVLDARRRSFTSLVRFNALTGLPKGATFAVKADLPLAFGLIRWLYTYLGMIPVAVVTPPAEMPALAQRLQDFLDEIGCAAAWQAAIEETDPEVLIADGETLAWLRNQGKTLVCIESEPATPAYMDLIPKPLLGAQGGLYLVEQIIQGLDRLV